MLSLHPLYLDRPTDKTLWLTRHGNSALEIQSPGSLAGKSSRSYERERSQQKMESSDFVNQSNTKWRQVSNLKSAQSHWSLAAIQFSCFSAPYVHKHRLTFLPSIVPSISNCFNALPRYWQRSAPLLVVFSMALLSATPVQLYQGASS